MSCKEAIKSIQENLRSSMEILDEVKDCIPEEVECFKSHADEAIDLGDKLLRWS